jgi:hypothetical protein
MNKRFYLALIIIIVMIGIAIAEETSFTRTFKVDKKNLVSEGENPYFILKSGYRLHFKSKDGTLTILVLDKIKTVDGVETRIVEEREKKDGQLTEVSRNYFAIDNNTKDVYYFGEDVDLYKDGKVVGHEGSWLSGEKGAKFGLMMPGKPKVGDRFYQELAPSVAMDRCEVVALDGELETPAENFKYCLRVKESSDLESGSGEKIYAAGVGLVKDDEYILAEIGEGNQQSFKGWEIYIWQDGEEICYALMVGTNRTKNEEEIKRAAVKGFDALKSKLDRIKKGEWVFIGGKQLDEPPPKKEAKVVWDYCDKRGLKLPVLRE